MKKYLISLCLLASCTYPVKTNHEDEVSAIKFVRDTLNFGAVKKGDSVQVSFHFRNSGKSKLRVLAVEASCSCSVAKYPHKEFSPGSSDSIVVRYASTRDNKGSFVTKTFVVQTNSKPSINVLTLQGLIN